MTKDKDKIIDPRSTFRREARRQLYHAYIPYQCVGCGQVPKEPPKDAPKHFEEIWPLENRTLDSQLQADHESKDLTNNDLEFLAWRCASCHKLHDMLSLPGFTTRATKKEIY